LTIYFYVDRRRQTPAKKATAAGADYVAFDVAKEAFVSEPAPKLNDIVVGRKSSLSSVIVPHPNGLSLKNDESILSAHLPGFLLPAPLIKLPQKEV
jgi:hypothetical protein